MKRIKPNVERHLENVRTSTLEKHTVVKDNKTGHLSYFNTEDEAVKNCVARNNYHGTTYRFTWYIELGPKPVKEQLS